MKFIELNKIYHPSVINEKKIKIGGDNELKNFKERRTRASKKLQEAQDEVDAYSAIASQIPKTDAKIAEIAQWLEKKGFIVESVGYRSIDPFSDDLQPFPSVAYEINFKSAGEAKVDKEFDQEYNGLLQAKGYDQGYVGRKQRVVIIPTK